MYRAEAAIAATERNEKGIEVPVNCLDWWKEKATTYPTIFTIMLRILCIPATSASSERNFSSAGLTIVKNRSRLTGDHAAAQVFLHDYYPALRLHEERSRRNAVTVIRD